MSCQRCGKVTCTMRYGCETSYDLGVRDGKASLLAEILGPNATPRDAAALANILQARHKGTERGELQALLVRLWGESPAIAETHVGTPSYDRILSEAEREIVRELGTHTSRTESGTYGERVATSDLRGLAARESQAPLTHATYDYEAIDPLSATIDPTPVVSER